ncbi:MAG: GNAT family N-acetyltransferase [Desulfobacteraceae bacterium]|nr:GNAT family N-acetyltransferase [Desulfobacteraceae bacterium]
MKISHATASDFDAWISLAREVEHLFGPMADEISFQEALKQAISDGTAFCVRSEKNEDDWILKGGIVISRESNEIAWFVVSGTSRGKGYGKALLNFAINQLNTHAPMVVQTFDNSVAEGQAARKLYGKFGFADHEKGAMNPAGVPTVIMQRPGSYSHFAL